MDHNLVTKLMEDKEFGGSIWGNTPPPRTTNTAVEAPAETILTVKLTKAEVESLLSAVEGDEALGSGGLIAKLKQALVNGR